MPPKKAGEPQTPSTKEDTTVDEPHEPAKTYKDSTAQEKTQVKNELDSFIRANFDNVYNSETTKKEPKKDGVKSEYKKTREEVLNGILDDPKKIHALLALVLDAFKETPCLLRIDKVPIYICGDIHGQHGDLLQLFEAVGKPWEARFLFLGDYVDRGESSLRVILLLFACRLKYPDNVYILRGNHELPNINKTYGFRAELQHRFRSSYPTEVQGLHDHFNDVFAWMSLAALVGRRILCMHGGLSPNLNDLEDINKIHRPAERVQQLGQDLLWADPDKAAGANFDKNKVRGVSYIFGPDALKKKCLELDIDVIVRAHQVVEFGYSLFGCNGKDLSKKREETGKSAPLTEGGILVTIFSAARYHDELLNYSAIVLVKKDLVMSFIQFKPADFLLQRNGTADRKAEEASN